MRLNWPFNFISEHHQDSASRKRRELGCIHSETRTANEKERRRSVAACRNKRHCLSWFVVRVCVDMHVPFRVPFHYRLARRVYDSRWSARSDPRSISDVRLSYKMAATRVATVSACAQKGDIEARQQISLCIVLAWSMGLQVRRIIYNGPLRASTVKPGSHNVFTHRQHHPLESLPNWLKAFTAQPGPRDILTY